jgi:hypothetical protein
VKLAGGSPSGFRENATENKHFDECDSRTQENEWAIAGTGARSSEDAVAGAEAVHPAIPGQWLWFLERGSKFRRGAFMNANHKLPPPLVDRLMYDVRSPRYGRGPQHLVRRIHLRCSAFGGTS